MNETEIYRRHRPKTFKEIVGQEEAKAVLQDLIKRDAVPHVLLFVGPSGSGKTTLARIMQGKLGCSDLDFREINAAKERGIEMVRMISDGMGLAPMGGKCRIWLIDEAGRLTHDGQSSLLKMLEDTPDHVYIFLATTDPHKLLATVKTRCTKIACNPLTQAELIKLIKNILIKEKKKLDNEVIEKIAEDSEGSARQALVYLHAVMGLSSTELQLKAIAAEGSRSQGFELAKLLFKGASWKEVAAVLKELKDADPLDSSYEKVRQIVMSYVTTVTLGGGKIQRAQLIYRCFQFDFFNNRFAGLVAACFECVHAK